MPNRQAARLIARDRVKNREARRRKIKNKDNKHSNQHEFLRISTRKRMANKAISDNDLMMMSDSQLSDYSIGDVPVESTETNKLYEYLL